MVYREQYNIMFCQHNNKSICCAPLNFPGGLTCRLTELLRVLKITADESVYNTDQQ